MTSPEQVVASPPEGRVDAGCSHRRAERTDAAQNRARVLAAAELFSSRNPRQITMSDIAAAAGVGRGTLYHRYPDLASIAVALLDEHERAVQEQLLRGDPPLGPGAAPAQRLAAFYAVPDPDPLVDLLLAPLAPDVYQHQRQRGLTPEWITAALVRLAHSVLPTSNPQDEPRGGSATPGSAEEGDVAERALRSLTGQGEAGDSAPGLAGLAGGRCGGLRLVHHDRSGYPVGKAERHSGAGAA
jgi:AcrR family transcriptional regulator